MIIEVSKVSPEGSHYEGEEPAEALDLGQEKHVRVASPIRYKLFAEVVKSELVVMGSLEADFSLECGRCVEFFSTTVCVPSFLRAYEIPEIGESVDVGPDLREDILLELDPYPLCSLECKGLCPQCGKNLNQGPCSCPPKEDPRPWGGLDDLKLP
jgi:uncharacterized protein